MTIEEVEELRIQEINNQLRLPNLQIEYRDINKVLAIQNFLYRIINNKCFVLKMVNRISLKKMGLEIDGKGTDDNPYILKSYYGEGKCFNIKHIFSHKRCPFKAGECFSNAFNMVCEMKNLPNVNKCYCVSGIALTQGENGWKRILHSVVELENWVLDVNLGLVMSKELYYKLFTFEELARFDGNQAEEMFTLLNNDSSREITKRFNLKTYHLVFAIDDCKDFVENEERRNNHKVFQELNYN